MTQPNILTVPFAQDAAPETINEIPITRDPSDPIQNASWSAGFPRATMQPLVTGGQPPNGQDFNGILKALSEHIVYQNKGGVYRWSADVVAAAGYSKGAVVQADDGIRSYVSLTDGNTQALGGSNWLLISMPIATVAQARALTSSDTLITPQRLGDSMNNHVLGMGQAWRDMTSSRSFATTYTNTTGRPIALMVTQYRNNTTPGSRVGLSLVVSGRSGTNQATSYNGSSNNTAVSLTLFDIILPGQEYTLDDNGDAPGRGTVVMELR